MIKTLKQIEDKYKKDVYGECDKCKIDFKYGDIFFEITKNRCSTSQGYPETFIFDRRIKLCEKCYDSSI